MVLQNRAREIGARTAADIADIVRPLTGWSDDDLSRLPLFQGEEFTPGEVYFDLTNPEQGPFRAAKGSKPDRASFYVAERDVPADLWERLVVAYDQSPGVFGNAAPTQGAFGQTEEVTASRGGTGTSQILPQQDFHGQEARHSP